MSVKWGKDNEDKAIYRYRKTSSDNGYFYSSIEFNGKDFDLDQSRHWSLLDDSHKAATPEEVSKLEKAERENGYYWNGEELVKLEYIKLKDGVPKWGIETDNKVFKVCKYINAPEHYEIEKLNELANVVGTPVCFVGDFEPATKEEYEAQENIDYKAKYFELKNKLQELIKE